MPVLRALLPLLALLAGALVYLGSELLVPAGTQCFSFGLDYQILSADPFAFGGQLPHRMLGPLLAWLIGLGGAEFPQFMRLCSVLLLATVFWFVGRERNGMDATLATCAVAVSGAVQTYKTVVGFPDQLSFALLLLALAAVRTPVLFWALNGLSLLNHEMLLFFLPWLLWQRRLAGISLLRDGVGLAIVGAFYAGFRLWVGAHVPQATLDANWYAGKSLFPLGTLWLWLLSFVYWVIDFGPLLAVVAFGAWATPRRGYSIGLALLCSGIFAIYAVVYVYDFFRFGSALCVPLVLAAMRLLDAKSGRAVFLALIVLSAIAFALWHPAASQLVGRPQGYVQVYDIDRITIETCALPDGTVDFTRLFTGVVPRIWPLLAGLAVELAALVALGYWLARRNGQSTKTQR